MASPNRQRQGALAKTVGFSAWAALVALFLLWQATSYRGIMSLIGEWQFNIVGRHYPTFNYALLVFLLCLPGYLLFLRPRRRAGAERLEAATLRSARMALRALLGAAAGLAGAALITLLVMLFLPGVTGERQAIDLSRPVPAVLAEGPTTISGQILYQRTAGFDEDMLVVRRSFRFAPIIGANQQSDHLRFFVQLPPVDTNSRGGLPLSGVLKRDGLPGEIVRLFRYAGYQVDDMHYVLFLDASAMRWPYLTLMGQFAIGALLAAVFALVQWRRLQVIDRAVHAETSETSPSA